MPSTTAAPTAFSAGTISPRRVLSSAVAIAIDKAPLVGRVPAVEGQLADNRVLGERLRSDLPAADERAQGDRQIKRSGIFRQVGRGQVDHDAALRALKARVDHRPLDAMRAFLDRGFREKTRTWLGQAAWRYIDLDLDGQGLDADERERLEFGEHIDFIPLFRWKRVGVRAAGFDVSAAPA